MTLIILVIIIFILSFFLGKYIASQSDDKSVRVWKTDDWKQETVVTEPFEEVCKAAQFIYVFFCLLLRRCNPLHDINHYIPLSCLNFFDYRLIISLFYLNLLCSVEGQLMFYA